MSLMVGGLDFQGQTGLLIVYLIPICLPLGTAAAGSARSSPSTARPLVPGHLGFNQLLTPSILTLGSFFARLAIFLVMTQSSRACANPCDTQHGTNAVHRARPAPPDIEFHHWPAYFSADQRTLGRVRERDGRVALVSNQRALTLVTRCWTCPKLATGKMELNLEHASSPSLWSKAFQQVALWANSEEIVLQPDISGSQRTPGYRSHHSRHRQACFPNALKNSPKGGTVKLS